MSLTYNLRLLLVFSVAFSLAGLGGVMSSDSHFPGIQLANAIPEHQFWYPAGPAMNSLVDIIFTD